MKNLGILFFATVFSLCAKAQADKKVESSINHVTVFLNKAQVTRTVKTRIEAGKTNLILQGLTSQLDEQSIQVAGKGNFVIMGINHNRNYLNEFDKPAGLKRLEDSLAYYNKLLFAEQNHKDILAKEEQLILGNQKLGGTQQNLTVAELRAMADFFRTRLNELGLAKISADEKIKKLNEHISKLNRQIAEQRGLYARNTSEIVVGLSAGAPAAVELEVSYVVANAGWHPVYDLRAVNTKDPLQLSYKANVFQNTGEEWKNVKLTLSTANPSQGGVKPELYTWYLDFRQPVYKALQGRAAGVEKSRSMAVMQTEDMAYAEEAMAPEPAESAADYVSTVQTSLNTEFAISLPYTVGSSSKPTVVDIRKYDMKADYRYAVAPRLDNDAFLMARATGWEAFSLLPGQANVFFEGTFVGKTFIDPNNIKDTLSVSLGRDKRIVVKREKLKDYTTRRTIGANRRDAYAWEISVRNTKNEPVRITVEDQVPVSKNNQIEVTVEDRGGAIYNETTGKFTWDLTLQPNETKKLQYRYEVKYPKDRIIDGLN